MQRLPVIGLLGHGRFGAALATLLEERGLDWIAWDAAGTVPDAHAVPDLDSLAARSGLIVLCVPLASFEAALRDLRPRLRGRHQVMDVCSVKESPCRLMDELLGDAIGHAGSHPLFGPLSIARAEPLRAVVCPSPRHPGTARLARELYLAIGCEVLEQDPSSHDRAMASTHAMAFFIARGLVDLGVGGDLRWSPPSFAALSASIAAVRADAGHLFTVIQNQNPYAAGARRRFIDALRRIDLRLAESRALDGEAESEPEPRALAPPDVSRAPAQVASLDRELIALLRRRVEAARRAGLAGRSGGEPSPDASGDAALLDMHRAWAAEEGLSGEAVAGLFERILALGGLGRDSGDAGRGKDANPF